MLRAGRHGTPLSCLLLDIEDLRERRSARTGLCWQSGRRLRRARAALRAASLRPRRALGGGRAAGRAARRGRAARGGRRPARCSAGCARSSWRRAGSAVAALRGRPRPVARGHERRSRCSLRARQRRRPTGAHQLGSYSRMLSGSELWLLRLMADRGLALLDAGSLLMVIEERGELRVAAASRRGHAAAAHPASRGQRAGGALPRGASRSRSTARGAPTRRGCTSSASRRAPRWSSRSRWRATAAAS